MKKIIVLVVVSIFSISCSTDDDVYPKVENITNGKKWNLQIGSSKIEVYNQLQELGMEKNFSQIQILGKQPYLKPEDIKSDISLYHYIYLEAESTYLDRVNFSFDQDKVISIEKGGALMDEILSKWPNNVSDEIAIHVDDPIDQIYAKLVSIYQNSTYRRYQISLINKILNRAYDPDMNNYDKWHFSFSEDVSLSIGRSSSVTVFFKNSNLHKIEIVTYEGEIMVDPIY